MKKVKNISAIVIAANENERIGDCLTGLNWADELLVVINNSDDGTSEIAKQKGAKVIFYESDSFSEVRNYAAQLASGNWLLYIDADEIVGDDLKTNILEVTKKENSKDGYLLKRRNYFYGKAWPGEEILLRLMKKQSLENWQGDLHETAVLKPGCSTEILSGYLIHDTHRNLSEMVDKTNKWSEIEADLRVKSNHPPMAVWRFFRVMITGFWDSYITKKGYKMGILGIIEAIFQSFSMFITYAKLWERQNKRMNGLKMTDER